MRSKKDVYVNLDTKKKVEKVLKVFNMFGEKNSRWTTSNDAPWVSGKKEVTIKELRNILAAEHLKKGDYFIGEIFGSRRVVKFDSFYNGHFTGNYQYPEGSISSGIGGFYNFIRFATDEEIQSFESKSRKKELTPDDYKDKTWYKHRSGYILFIDKSVDSHLCITSMGNCFHDVNWFKNFQLNEFHEPGVWTKVSYKELSDIVNKLSK